MHERESLVATRVTASPDSIDAAAWPDESLVLRIAPDEVLMIGDGVPRIPDPHAIVVPDTGWAGFRMAAPNAAVLMEQTAAWPLPAHGFGQGMVAAIAAKVWVGRMEVLVVVPGPHADEFEARLSRVWETSR